MAIMNSDGVRAGATITDIRRKRAKPSGDTRFTLAAGAKAVSGATFEPAVVTITSLLSIQEQPDHDSTRGERVRRGDALLEKLDELRVDLLAGVVPYGRLSALADSLRAKSRASGDERLDRIVGEIELRASVEIAKLERRR